jgi:hypothetical protein
MTVNEPLTATKKAELARRIRHYEKWYRKVLA